MIVITSGRSLTAQVKEAERCNVRNAAAIIFTGWIMAAEEEALEAVEGETSIN